MPKLPNRLRSSGLALALIPLLALGHQAPTAPSDNPQPVGGAWDFLHLDPKVKVKLSFRNANIDNVIELFENASQVTILKDPTLRGPITLMTAKAVRLREAFHVFNAMLKLQGYELTRDGEILVIQKMKPPAPPQKQEQAQQQQPPPESTETTVVWYPLEYANAGQVSRAINDIFQPFPPNPEPRNRDRQPVPLTKYYPPQMPPVRASYEEFSNSVVINAPQAQQAELAELIKQIDQPQSDGQITKAYTLQYATASDILPSVITMLSANVIKGRGWKGNNNLAQEFFGFPYSQQNQGLAVADSRTNSILVSGPPDLIKVADKIIEALDQRRDYVGTSYVFKLKYARADSIANLLTTAFGQRQGVNNNFRPANISLTPSNNLFNNTAANARPNLKVLGGSKLTPPAAGGQTAQPGVVDQGVSDANSVNKSLSVPLQDPNASSGDLLTSVGVTQAIAKPVVGHDSDGKVVTVHDLAGQVTVVADTNTNSIICVTAPDNLEIIKNIIDQLDVRPDQVMIQTIIVEATLDKAKQFGLEWNYAQGKSGSGSQTFGLQNPPANTPPLQGFSYTLTSGNLSAFFNMLQTDTKFQVLATPRIFTSNNMESQINISQQIPYVTSTIENVNGTFSSAYTFQDVGIVLTVTPHITNDGYVTMDVLQTANDLQGYTSFNAPIVNQRQAETTISAKDNETIVLGGMIRNQVTSTVNKVPVLGDIPLLGNLFRSTNMDHQKTELLVFLTPRIIRDPAEAQKLKNESDKELTPETQKFVKPPAPTKGTAKSGQ